MTQRWKENMTFAKSLHDLSKEIIESIETYNFFPAQKKRCLNKCRWVFI